jgi:hypothetical protein
MWLPTWITTNPSRVAKRERERERERKIQGTIIGEINNIEKKKAVST